MELLKKSPAKCCWHCKYGLRCRVEGKLDKKDSSMPYVIAGSEYLHYNIMDKLNWDMTLIFCMADGLMQKFIDKWPTYRFYDDYVERLRSEEKHKEEENEYYSFYPWMGNDVIYESERFRRYTDTCPNFCLREELKSKKEKL